jgi:hypothetical protein
VGEVDDCETLDEEPLLAQGVPVVRRDPGVSAVALDRARTIEQS